MSKSCDGTSDGTDRSQATGQLLYHILSQNGVYGSTQTFQSEEDRQTDDPRIALINIGSVLAHELFDPMPN